MAFYSLEDYYWSRTLDPSFTESLELAMTEVPLPEDATPALCDAMCPEAERLRRTEHKDLIFFEIVRRPPSNPQ